MQRSAERRQAKPAKKSDSAFLYLQPLPECYRINVYSCKNGHDLVTVDRHEGTTPMMIKCLECATPSLSRWYRVDQELKPTHEWVQPDVSELQFMPTNLRAHVIGGGLILKEIKP